MPIDMLRQEVQVGCECVCVVVWWWCGGVVVVVVGGRGQGALLLRVRREPLGKWSKSLPG